MEKYDSINDYLNSMDLTKEDIKDYILHSSLVLGCECAHLFDGDGKEVESIFLTLEKFNSILDNVK